MNDGWNLPPGCNPNDLPGNSRAEIHQADQWEKNEKWVEQQAREELMTLCGRQGEVVAAYLDHVRDSGICNHLQFVRMLERTSNPLWVRLTQKIFERQFGD